MSTVTLSPDRPPHSNVTQDRPILRSVANDAAPDNPFCEGRGHILTCHFLQGSDPGGGGSVLSGGG